MNTADTSTDYTGDAAGGADAGAAADAADTSFGVISHEALTYAEIQGYRPLLLDLHLPATASPENPAPFVVWLHGGAFWSGDRRYLPGNLAPNAVFTTLAAAGIASATIDYRLSGEASYPAQLDDLRAAISYLTANATRWGLDPTRIGVWGESSGGTLAALAALAPTEERDAGTVGGEPEPNPPIAAAALWCSPTDLVSLRHFSAIYLLLGSTDGTGDHLEAAAAEASPLAHVRRQAPPFLIQHATDDATVPFEQSQVLHDALLAAGARSTLVAVPEAGHVFKNHSSPQELIDQAVAFFAGELLRPSR